MLVPVMPLSPSETQVTAGHAQVGSGPVTGVGADGPPLTLHQHLQTPPVLFLPR